MNEEIENFGHDSIKALIDLNIRDIYWRDDGDDPEDIYSSGLLICNGEYDGHGCLFRNT